MSWTNTDSTTNETGWEVERSPYANGPFNDVQPNGPLSDTTYTDPGLTPNTIYYYRVAYFNTFGDSGFSNVLVAKTGYITTVYSNDFDGHTVGTGSWSTGVTAAQDNTSNHFWGASISGIKGFTGSTQVKLTLNNLPAHAGGFLDVNPFFMDAWQGNEFKISVNGKLLYDSTFTNRFVDDLGNVYEAGAAQVDSDEPAAALSEPGPDDNNTQYTNGYYSVGGTCGFNIADSQYRLLLPISENGTGSVTFTFEAPGLPTANIPNPLDVHSPNDWANWGLDNVNVLMNTPPPQPPQCSCEQGGSPNLAQNSSGGSAGSNTGFDAGGGSDSMGGSATGSAGGSDVNAGTGAITLASTDLSSDNFSGFSQSRGVTNQTVFGAGGINGAGTALADHPYLSQLGSGAVVLTTDAQNTRWFDGSDAGGWTERFFGQDTLLHTTDGGSPAYPIYRFTDTLGNVSTYFDFTNSSPGVPGWPTAIQGKIRSYTDANGNSTTYTYDSSGVLQSVSQTNGTSTESWTSSYYAGSFNSGLLQMETETRTGSSVPVRQTVYRYFDGRSAGGNASDLMSATTEVGGPGGLAASLATGGALAINTPYYYVITAITAGGESNATAEVTASTDSTNRKITLSWTAFAGATGYKIYRAGASEGEVYLDQIGSVASYTDDGSKAPGSAVPPVTAIDTTAYRYWVAGETADVNSTTTDQPVGLVKAVYGSQSYARALAAGHDPATAADADVLAYADKSFTYYNDVANDPAHLGWVGSETLLGSGTSTFTYPLTSSFDPGYNVWSAKAVEKLPDQSTSTVYTNYANEPILKAFYDHSSGLTYYTFFKYDSAGRLLWVAHPSAVSGADESKPDLVNDGGSPTYISQTSGLITGTDYYSTNSASATAGGGVVGYVQDTYVKKGETGTKTLVDATDYYAITASSGATVYPVADQTSYGDTGSGDARTTKYFYKYASGTTQLQSQITVLPTVSLAQNGTGSVTGIASSGSQTTLVDSTLTQPDGYFIGWALRITSGTDVNQVATVTNFVSSTHTLTFTTNASPGFSSSIDSTSHYTLMPDASVQVFDNFGRVIWAKDADGYMSYTQYDGTTGAVVKSIQDVNTANSSDFTALPFGWSTRSGAGLELITSDVVDSMGRSTQHTEPDGSVSYTVYNDANHETRDYPGWTTATGIATGTASANNQLVDTTRTEPTGYFANWALIVTSGTDAGTSVTVTGYDATSHTFTFTPAFGSLTNNTSHYLLDRTTGPIRVSREYRPGVIVSGKASTGGSQTTLTDTTDLTSGGNYVGLTLVITGGKDAGQVATVISYDPIGKTLTFSPGFTDNTDATSVFVLNSTTVYEESLTASGAPTINTSGQPTGTEPINELNIQSLSRDLTNDSGQVSDHLDFANLTSATYTSVFAKFGTAFTIGGVGSAWNYADTVYGYDAQGRQDRVVSPNGTRTRTVYNGLGLPTSVWVGTDDTGATDSTPNGASPNNMLDVQDDQYDNGSYGDSTLTRITAHLDGTAADDRVTLNLYDYQDRLIATKQGAKLDSLGNPSPSTETDSAHRLVTYYDLDNLGEVKGSYQYAGDTLDVSAFASWVPSPLTDGTALRAKMTNLYDDQGRVYKQSTFSVDSGGNVTTSLDAYTWYDHRGNQIKALSPGGLVQKWVYDGAGRNTVQYISDGGGDATPASSSNSWLDATTVTGDTVLLQVETKYDANGNPTLVTDRERFHNATGTGGLGTYNSGVLARVSYTANYYDAADRLTDTLDLGTNGGGAAITSPPSLSPPPSGSLHTVYQYFYVSPSSGGHYQAVTDPTGLETVTLYDFDGRTTDLIEAWDKTNGPYPLPSPTSSNNRITDYRYYGGGQVYTMKAMLPSGTSPADHQTTLYAYGVGTVIGTDLFSDDLLAKVEYPVATGTGAGDPNSAASGQQNYTYDRGGEKATFTDQNGSVHTYFYDVLGRLTGDQASTIGAGSGIDGTIRRLGFTFDDAGRPYQQTSYSNTGGTTVVNQVRDVYNGFGQLTTEYQEHLGAVNTGSSKKVQYGYTYGSNSTTGQTFSRLTSMTYPNGRIEDYAYGTQEPISSITAAGTTATATYAGINLFTVGDTVVIAGSLVAAFNGTFTISGINTGTSTFTYTIASTTATANDSDIRALDTTADPLDNAISRTAAIQDHAGSGVGSVESYKYLGLSTIVSRTRPNNSQLTYAPTTVAGGDGGDQYTGLDRFGRVVDQKWTTSGSATDEFQYGYDADSNVLYKLNSVSSANSELYHGNSGANTYDNFNRLREFQRGTLNGTHDSITGAASRDLTFTLDPLGNTTAEGGTVSNTRTFNALNEVATQSGFTTTPTYDNNGNMKRDETNHVATYDAWNRMVGNTNGGGETFVYDADNRRPSLSICAGAVTDSFYSSDWQILEEDNRVCTSMTATSQYVWGLGYVDDLILRDDNSGTTTNYGTASSGLHTRKFAQQDANYNVTSITDTSGAVTVRVQYDPYGTPTYLTNLWATGGSLPSGWEPLFQGLRYDSGSGKYDARSRQLDPTLGVWMRPDYNYFDGLDLYQIERDSPAGRTDSFGLTTEQMQPFAVGSQLHENGSVLMTFGNWLYDIRAFKDENMVGISGIGAEIDLQYWPDATKVCCRDIKIIQLLKFSHNDEDQYAKNSNHQHESNIGWGVDFVQMGGPPLTNPYYASYGHPGSAGQAIPYKEAKIYDYPQVEDIWPQARGDWDWSFQDFAVCAAGVDHGKLYDGVAWAVHARIRFLGSHSWYDRPTALSGMTREFAFSLQALSKFTGVNWSFQ